MWWAQIAGGNGQPFVLSQKFFYNASASRFPMETGIEALGTTQWLAEHEPEVDEDWVPLPSENLCGQLIQLLGIVSDGELVIAPFLPEEGVGESEDNKNVVIGTKRKTEGGQEIQFMKPKIQRSESSSPGFRRERGFPGVQVFFFSNFHFSLDERSVTFRISRALLQGLFSCGMF